MENLEEKRLKENDFPFDNDSCFPEIIVWKRTRDLKIEKIHQLVSGEFPGPFNRPKLGPGETRPTDSTRRSPDTTRILYRLVVSEVRNSMGGKRQRHNSKAYLTMEEAKEASILFRMQFELRGKGAKATKEKVQLVRDAHAASVSSSRCSRGSCQ